MTWWTEDGPAKSGKTTRLVERANELAARGHRVVFRNVELNEQALLALGLDSSIDVWFDPTPGTVEAIGVKP